MFDCGLVVGVGVLLCVEVVLECVLKRICCYLIICMFVLGVFLFGIRGCLGVFFMVVY